MNVAICGGLCSGKTTAAFGLAGERGHARVSLAAALKELNAMLMLGDGQDGMLRALEYSATLVRQYNTMAGQLRVPWLLPTIEDVFHGILLALRDIPVQDGKPRERLQFLGHEVRQRVSPMFWILVLEYHMRQLLRRDETVHFVIDDVRYNNEFLHFVKNPQWVVFKLAVSPHVQRERAILQGHPTGGQFVQHASEADITQILSLPAGHLIEADQSVDSVLSNMLVIYDREEQL